MGKRTHDQMEGKERKDANDGPSSSTSPFMPMFAHFRAELDEHHDRRQRLITASRDITAASKKIIFTLQRIRAINQPLPNHVTKGNKQYYETITNQFTSVAPDLKDLNAWRYARQISGGCQEWMEAISFQHYLTNSELLPYSEAAAQLQALGVDLSAEDYLLGVYDMTGELMRFAITAMATSGALPESGEGRTVLDDMRAMRSALESMEAGTGPFAKDVEKKMEVMRASVEKVERSLYGLVVRGAERPKGWMPDADGGRTVGVEG